MRRSRIIWSTKELFATKQYRRSIQFVFSCFQCVSIILDWYAERCNTKVGNCSRRFEYSPVFVGHRSFYSYLHQIERLTRVNCYRYLCFTCSDIPSTAYKAIVRILLPSTLFRHTQKQLRYSTNKIISTMMNKNAEIMLQQVADVLLNTFSGYTNSSIT
jgi:hypothetical protein